MSFLKILLTGDAAELESDSLTFDSEIDDSEPPKLGKTETNNPRELPSPYDPERANQIVQDRDAVEVRERDEVVARVGNLFLAVESLLRLLKTKGMINDLDLRRMQQQVDVEIDGDVPNRP